MKVNNLYTSVACNQTPESADWGNNGLIVFAACNAVAILDPNYKGSARVVRTFEAHKKRVNAVKWVRRTSTENETQFISASDDGLAIYWDMSNSPEIPSSHAILQGHESSVNVVDTIYVEGKLTVATASTDSTLKLWNFDRDAFVFTCFQTILLQAGFCLTMRITTLPKSDQILLAYGADDDNINLWTEIKSDERKFTNLHQLTGHEDWVRSMDFVLTEDGDLLLASSSQDNFIRLWRISPRSEIEVQQNVVDLLNIPDGDIHIEEKILEVRNVVNDKVEYFAVGLESVLYGHEGWVYGVHWKHNGNDLQLLSASIDKTLIIWELTEDDIWLEKIRVGEVGGNSLGFFGGKFSNDGKAILGHGFQGSFHIWEQSSDDAKIWKPKVITGGHFGEVRDMCWEPEGQYLFSVSADQTTRIHAPWVRPNDLEVTWHEIARPQVHGYDMQSIAALSRYKFASGAEEKIVRIFEAPGNFIENFRRICDAAIDAEGDSILENLPKGASVPSLGLSNKAVYDCDESDSSKKHVKDVYPENYFVPVTLTSPPQEETLMQNTLWPEIQKLYGHGFGIFALTASPDGKILASSCKAASSLDAQIILWDTTTWKQIAKLTSHMLTVTQMKFSPNNKYLISVSRDRRWTLFENVSESEISCFQIVATTDKKNGVHSRIIWSCDWSPDSKIFVTTSRDGKAVAWSKSDSLGNTSLGAWTNFVPLEIEHQSITAVSIAPTCLYNKDNEYLVALGLETGKILLYKFNGKWESLYEISSEAHHLAIKKLIFRPVLGIYHLASCGEDQFVRIHEILLDT